MTRDGHDRESQPGTPLAVSLGAIVAVFVLSVLIAGYAAFRDSPGIAQFQAERRAAKERPPVASTTVEADSATTLPLEEAGDIEGAGGSGETVRPADQHRDDSQD